MSDLSIPAAIMRMATAGMELYCKVCSVDAVDETERTIDCSPIDEGAPLLGVNLQANQEGEDGIVLFPAIGSYVVVAFISSAVAVVVLSDKIDKVMLKIGITSAKIEDGQIDVATDNIKAQMTSKGIVLNGGALGGLVISKKTADKLNALEKELNELKAVFTGWTPVTQDGGGALKGAISSWAGKSVKTTIAKDLENEKVKH